MDADTQEMSNGWIEMDVIVQLALIRTRLEREEVRVKVKTVMWDSVLNGSLTRQTRLTGPYGEKDAEMGLALFH
jgi:hypothetical protein